jgi:RNA polymerase II elongation factor ELL
MLLWFAEGVKDREKTCITAVLKQISSMRDNTFHLNRHIWNDVHEDWPFYTEQDRQSLKRRKPQNLTPPLSSDGGSSSTSGQSPTSTHNGSPPPAVKRPALKNDAFDGPVPKKTRVSHYKKEVNHDNVR